MSLCKLCGEDRRLVDAHIIPKSMYPFDEPREPLLMVPYSGHLSGPVQARCLRP